MMRKALLVICCALSAACWERPPVDAVQKNYRGLGIEQLSNPRTVAEQVELNKFPEPLPPVAAGSPPAGVVGRNVKVLGHVGYAEFMRLMGGITTWVAPNEGCNYCHGGADFALEDSYRKTVSRRMIQMVQDINSNWKDHVGDTGVTCYTCHRGVGVPTRTWSIDPGPKHAVFAGNKQGQNTPGLAVGLTSLPYDPFKDYLYGEENIRVQSPTALPTTDHSSIQQTERTYGLMIHISESLGVNCGYCHNSRSFMPWDASSPARATAWHAIRMVRHINEDYITPLTDILPASGKGPEGDALKVNCATCHRGVAKPLLGAQMLKDYPELAAPGPLTPPVAPEPTPEPEPAAEAPPEPPPAS